MRISVNSLPTRRVVEPAMNHTALRAGAYPHVRQIMKYDGYDSFRLLSQELKNLGLYLESEAINTALESGSTGSVCLGLAGEALNLLRVQQHDIVSNTLALQVKACIRSVQIAWPKYR